MNLQGFLPWRGRDGRARSPQMGIKCDHKWAAQTTPSGMSCCACGGFFVLIAWFCFSAHGATPHLKPSLPGEAGGQRRVELHPLRASVACCCRGPAPLPRPSSPEPCPEAALLFLPCPGFALPAPPLPDSLAVLSLLSWGASVPTPWG